MAYARTGCRRACAGSYNCSCADMALTAGVPGLARSACELVHTAGGGVSAIGTDMREHVLLFCLLGLVLIAAIMLLIAPEAVTWALSLVE